MAIGGRRHCGLELTIVQLPTDFTPRTGEERELAEWYADSESFRVSLNEGAGRGGESVVILECRLRRHLFNYRHR